MKHIIFALATCCVFIQSFAQKSMTAPPLQPPSVVAAEGPLNTVDEPAEFLGGLQELRKFMGNNIEYPEDALEAAIEGQVMARFVIGKDGFVTDIQILKDLGGGTGKEVIRVLRKMPRWKPAMKDKRPVASYYQLPVRFMLPDMGEEVGAAPPERPKQELADTEEIYRSVQEVAEFPGGRSALFKYLANSVRYPFEAVKNKVSGQVVSVFVINKDGSVSDIRITRDLGYGTAEEVIRVLNAMPTWSPAKINGKPVRSYFALPVSFKM